MMVLAEVAAIHTVAKIVISPVNARDSLKFFKNGASFRRRIPDLISRD